MKATKQRKLANPQRETSSHQPTGPLQQQVDRSTHQQAIAQRIEASQGRSDALPAQLQNRLHAMSGVDTSDVRVHRNSTKPAQLQAHAYAQGRDIHLAPGQEHHLPHEAWHIVQQRQGRVKPTLHSEGVAINDDHSLEREADLKGAQAAQAPLQQKADSSGTAQLGKHGKKGLTRKRNRERQIRENKDRPDNRVWLPSGEIGVGEPPEGFATWAEWVDYKQRGRDM